MKKLIVGLCLAVMMTAAPVFGVTFPTLDDQTLVSSDGNGIINVKVNGESGWEMILYCQDNLRAGCGNKFGIQPFEQSAGIMKYQIPQDAIADGQVAFNFKKSGAWLYIPDCRVKTGGQVGMGMSFYTKTIDESGGAHFVYTGGGTKVWSPVSAGACGSAKVASAAPFVKKESATITAPAAPAKKYGKRADGSICQEPCMQEVVAKVRDIKQDTTAIRESVGDVDKTEPADEQTVQQKSRKILKKTTVIEKSVGVAAPPKGLPEKSLHEKIGEPTKEGETVMGVLKDIQKNVAPKTVTVPSKLKVAEQSYWDTIDWPKTLGWIAILIIVILVIWIATRRRRP